MAIPGEFETPMPGEFETPKKPTRKELKEQKEAEKARQAAVAIEAEKQKNNRFWATLGQVRSPSPIPIEDGAATEGVEAALEAVLEADGFVGAAQGQAEEASEAGKQNEATETKGTRKRSRSNADEGADRRRPSKGGEEDEGGGGECGGE